MDHNHFLTLSGLQLLSDTKWLKPFSDIKWITAISWLCYKGKENYDAKQKKYVDAHHLTLYTKHINSRKSCHLTETDFVKQTLKWIVTSRPKKHKISCLAKLIYFKIKVSGIQWVRNSPLPAGRYCTFRLPLSRLTSWVKRHDIGYMYKSGRVVFIIHVYIIYV